MRFTSIPDHFAPAFGEVIYEIAADAGESITDVEVYDSGTGELLGVKRFAPAGTVRANVGGYVRRRLDPQPLMPLEVQSTITNWDLSTSVDPQSGALLTHEAREVDVPAGEYTCASGQVEKPYIPSSTPPAHQRAGISRGFHFSIDAGRQAAITGGAGEAVAPARVFTCALVQVGEFDILSKMPRARILAEGEWDEISVAVPDTVLWAGMRVTGDGVDFTLRTEQFAAEQGIATLIVDAQAIADAAFAQSGGRRFADCRRAEVKIYAHDELIGEVDYELRSSSPEQMRICWLNSLGGMDYHTFLCTAEESASVSRQRILSDGKYRTVAAAAEKSSEIVSDYCAPPLSEALSEVVTSPRVWRVDRNAAGKCSATLLDISTDKAVSRRGELFSMRLICNYELRITNYE